MILSKKLFLVWVFYYVSFKDFSFDSTHLTPLTELPMVSRLGDQVASPNRPGTTMMITPLGHGDFNDTSRLKIENITIYSTFQS